MIQLTIHILSIDDVHMYLINRKTDKLNLFSVSSSTPYSYNLSTYPFLDSVPSEEDIGFKCQDHHAGFYASIKYSCQVYI